MGNRIYRSISEPIRVDVSWEERWKSNDQGLIGCWEVGREMRTKRPELAEKANRRELPVLGLKGGVEQKLKKREKYGSLLYLAEWQGLRGDDLDIELGVEKQITCSRTGVKVLFTSNIEKLGIA